MHPREWICSDVVGDNIQRHRVQDGVAALPHSYLVAKLWANKAGAHGHLGQGHDEVEVADSFAQLVEKGKMFPHFNQQLVQNCVGDARYLSGGVFDQLVFHQELCGDEGDDVPALLNLLRALREVLCRVLLKPSRHQVDRKALLVAVGWKHHKIAAFG